MRTDSFADLSACTEFRQTLLARPPKVVHGAAALLVLLLAAAVTWGALTKADLVVRAPGRVRPTSTTWKVVPTGRPDVISGGSSLRVAAVLFREGDEVQKDQVLLRMDTHFVDNEIAKREKALNNAEEELKKLGALRPARARQLEKTKGVFDNKIKDALVEIRKATDQQESDVREAEMVLKKARTDEQEVRVGLGKYSTLQQLRDLEEKTKKAEEALKKVRLAVNASKIDTLRAEKEQAEEDFNVEMKKLELELALKEGEIQVARRELSGLRQQREHAVVRAEASGVITFGDLKEGSVVEPGKPVAEIASQKGFRFEALVPSEEVGHLRAGMPARLKLDAYDYQKYGTGRGVVTYVSADSTTAEGQPGAVYVVRIELESDEVGRGEYQGRVKLGMAGQVEVVTETDSLLWLLLRKVRRTVSLG